MSQAPSPISRALAWLADAPLFLDSRQVTAFYNAVLRPQCEDGVIELPSRDQGQADVIQKIIPLYPFLNTSRPNQGTDEAHQQKLDSRNAIQLYATTEPERQLVQLALHYAYNLPYRIGNSLSGPAQSWMEEAFVEALPRALVFLEFPRRTPFMPMAAELAQGNVVTFYERLSKAFAPGEKPPTYPGSDPEFKEQRNEYWKWFRKKFNDVGAMTTVERVIADGGRTRWIDYRVPVTPDGTTVHLHVCGREQYDTGTFAYNLIKRGYKHGLRLVGTLKSEPDVNVLAIFDR